MPPIPNLNASSPPQASSSTYPPTPATTPRPLPPTDTFSSSSPLTSSLACVLLPANILPANVFSASPSTFPSSFSISLINLSSHNLSVLLAVAITTSVLFIAILCWLVVVQARLSRIIRREQSTSNSRSSPEGEKQKRRASAPPSIRLDTDGITPFSMPTSTFASTSSTRKFSPSNHPNGETRHLAAESPSNSSQAESPIDTVCATRGVSTSPLTHNCNAESRSPYPPCHTSSIYRHERDFFDRGSQPPSYSNIELSLPSPIREEEVEGPSSATTARFMILSPSIPPLSPITPQPLSSPSRPSVRVRPLPPLPRATVMPSSSSPSCSDFRIIHPSSSISSFGASSVLSSPTGMTPTMTPLDVTPRFPTQHSLPSGASRLLGRVLNLNHGHAREGGFMQFPIPPPGDDEYYSARPLLMHSHSTLSSSWPYPQVRRMDSSTSSLQALSLAHSNWDMPGYRTQFTTVSSSSPFPSPLDSSLDAPSYSVPASPSREGFKAVPFVKSSSKSGASSRISSFIQSVSQVDE